MKEFVIAGIDYSITSPSIVVHRGNEWNASTCFAYYFDDRKCAPVNPKSKMILKYSIYPFWKTPEERYEMLALWAISIILSHQPDKIYIEDYAFSRGGGSGLVFNIAENGGVLKNYLYCFNFPFVVVSPTDLKYWATGKGKAKKEEIEDVFVKDSGIENFRDILNLSPKSSSPISDIIDAYFLAKYGFTDTLLGIDNKKQKSEMRRSLKSFKGRKK